MNPSTVELASLTEGAGFRVEQVVPLRDYVVSKKVVVARRVQVEAVKLPHAPPQ